MKICYIDLGGTVRFWCVHSVLPKKKNISILLTFGINRMSLTKDAAAQAQAQAQAQQVFWGRDRCHQHPTLSTTTASAVPHHLPLNLELELCSLL